MRLTIIGSVVILLGFGSLAHAQSDAPKLDSVFIMLKARLVDKGDGSPVAYAHIVNARTQQGTTTDNDGYFSLEMLKVDSLGILAIGYMKDYLHVPANYSPDSVFAFYARSLRFPLSEVEVTANKKELEIEGLGTGKPVDISPELRGDAFNSKPFFLVAAKSPTSFLYYLLSGREKEKRKVRTSIAENERWEQLSKVYNREKVMELTGLNKQEADTFMIYFNQNYPIAKLSSEYDVRVAIFDQYSAYKREHNEAKMEENESRNPAPRQAN